MDRDAVIAALRTHERELRASGVIRLAMFGSVARGDLGPRSDVDVVVQLAKAESREGFAYFARVDDLEHRLCAVVGRPVDVVTAPVRRDGLRHAIEREAVHAF